MFPTERTLERTSPADLFDAAVDPGRDPELHTLGLEVIARPGAVDVDPVERGDVFVRRGLGEGRLAVVGEVAGGLEPRQALEARGVPCEGRGTGLFAEIDAGGRRYGRRVVEEDGAVARDTAVLRVRGRRAPAAPEDDGVPPLQPAVAGAAARVAQQAAAAALRAAAAELSNAAEAVRARRRPSLRAEQLRAALAPPSGAAPLQAELDRAAAELLRRVQALPAGADRGPVAGELAAGLVTAAERAFILDPQRSALELLEPAEQARFLAFAWGENDFPGGPAGTNEARARELFAALTRLRPERRANQGPDAVVRREELDDALQRRVEGALVPVPGERGQRLHRDAAAAWVAARTAASAEGVTLSINNSFRTLQAAQAGAQAAGNRGAVAQFSSHSLGLAVDLNLSNPARRYVETSTRPFQNLVDMYRSPGHKWMFFRGEAHGWFPYGWEPWHWEYNPVGFRARFRGREAGRTAEADDVPAEVASDPVVPVLPPLSLTGAVGRRGRNAAADVRAVQDRLVALRAMSAADAAAERPAGAGAVAEAALARTIAGVEALQREHGLRASGAVDDAGTRLALDRGIPIPTAAEYAAVSTRRAAIGHVVTRGLRLDGAVGAAPSANAPADVRAVQARLVEHGELAAAHGEAPAAAATAPVPAGALRATIAALRRFQDDVRFWVRRGTISGAVTEGVAAPGDATAALLDRVSVYQVSSGTERARFHDHVASWATDSEIGVAFTGVAAPSAIPAADWVALGLGAGQAAALQVVSRMEGNFDAINTYDLARASAGFIQFAGSRGLPSYLALWKSRNGGKFRSLLQDVGIDVEFTVSGGRIRAARTVVLDPARSVVLRGEGAEQAIREDKRLTAALVFSGRDRDVQRVQIEAAIRDYAVPALDARVTWGAITAPLRELVRSERGMAMLFDRAIQEGLGGAQTRFERVIRAVHAARAAATLAALQAREAEVLTALRADLQAAADVAASLARAGAALDGLLRAARAGSATVAGVLALPALAEARGGVAAALARLAGVVNVATPRGSTADAVIASLSAALRAEGARLAFAPPPPSPRDLAGAIDASRRALAAAARPVGRSNAFLQRLERIWGSSLASP